MTQLKITRRQGLVGLGATTLAGLNAATASAAVQDASFDQSNIIWNTLDGFDHIWYHVVKVDAEKKIVDVLFKFAANEQVVKHRHHADYSTFILQGELRIYNDAGDLAEIRPTASYVEKKAGGAPHTEGGGDIDCIALFSNRGTDGVIYEVLGPNNETIANLGLVEFQALWEAQQPPVQPIIPG